ncbi:unnamed protein product [Acanthoscelides obtectus]|uniref:Uncharacterized protein n=1 Tax=Acanthoscelides obtectus TaxID=200917 RepID=A0A9P0LE99_ACAOB|nr:unnamed protein product [Acanthoscelides obtectus]CAK1624394.1 hypothetical protein AOBTE_LOCUS2542 [Acanthoscelides obtectus]
MFSGRCCAIRSRKTEELSVYCSSHFNQYYRAVLPCTDRAPHRETNFSNTS